MRRPVMALFNYDEKTLKLVLDESNLCIEEKVLISKLLVLFEKHGYDLDSSTTGMYPSPDFGYFNLAGRFWRASLCIYFAGFSKAFIEAGAGFHEPWLFNARHSIELYLKGCILYTSWYEELIQDLSSSGYRTQLEKIQTNHALSDLHNTYKISLKKVAASWNNDEITHPKINELLLSEHCEKILTEISQADPNGFKFRYPSIIRKISKDEKIHEIQQSSWQWNRDELFPVTGLPMRAGVAFSHVKPMNAIHDLIVEFRKIEDQHDGFYAYIEELQGFQSEGL